MCSSSRLWFFGKDNKYFKITILEEIYRYNAVKFRSDT